jgi:hypothetical protein
MGLYAFDGTWDTDQRDDVTNVVKIARLYAARTSQDAVCYQPGVGTRLGWIGKAIGGAFGAGELYRIRQAYQALCARWAAGDHAIHLLGFSRGAATALDFANTIAARGITDPRSGALVEPKPKIQWIGLFDCVGAFGVGALLGDAPWSNFGHKLRLPPALVDYCFHAIALDENRPSFGVIRVAWAHEVHFRGVHSDVGGGNGNVGLNHIVLRWLIRKIIAAGGPLTSEDLAAAARADPTASPRLHSITTGWRTLTAADRRHYTVCAGAGCCPIDIMTLVEDEAAEALAQGMAAPV